MARKIDVGKISGNFYGGLPYTASWSFNGGNSPSTLNISVVNESGEYAITDNDLTFNNTVTVGLGQFSFVGYLVGYDIEKTPEQTILNLQYIDKSVDLEKIYVGLYKRHGFKTGDYRNLIIVGKEYHPCDTNHDSTISYQESSNISNIDPCDPCPYMPEDKYAKACDPIRSEFQIFEVFYTLNDLLAQLPFRHSGVPQLNTMYKAQHTGTLKSVLSAWCSELGLAYYWDPFQNSLFFVDRSQPLSIPSGLESEANATQYKRGATKQNTFARGFIGYFAKQGEFHKYTCEIDPKKSFQTTSPFLISDLQGGYSYGGGSGGGSIDPIYEELACVFSKYGKPLRDAYLWHYFYGIKTAQDLNSKVYDQNTSQGSSNVFVKLGNMKVLGVVHPSIQTKLAAEYDATSRVVFEQEIDEMLKREKEKNPDWVTNPSWYFFIADVNDSLAETQFENQQKIANGFMGKYWYKYYDTPIPNATNSNTQISIETPDGGNGEWYISKKELTSLPIFGFGHAPDSRIGSLAQVVVDDTKKGIIPPDENKKLYSTRAFILANRDAKFIPEAQQATEDYKPLYDWYDNYTSFKMINGDGRPDKLFDLWPEAKTNKNIKLFVGRQYSDFKLNTEIVPHPLEPGEMSDKTKTEENFVGSPVVTKLGKYGLTNNNCVKITVGSGTGDNMDKIDMVIYTPAQALYSSSGFTSAGGSFSYSGNEEITEGYTLHTQVSAEFPKVMPKVQYTVGFDAPSTDVASLDYNYKEIQESNLALLRGKSCVPNSADIADYANQLAENCSFAQSSPQKTASLTLPGIVPKIYDISQALNSIQINISENSSYTTYSFQDTVVQKPGEEYFFQYLLDRAKGTPTLAANNFTTSQANSAAIGLGR